MKRGEVVCCWILILLLFAFAALTTGKRREQIAKEAARQVEIDTFYQVNHCRPEGYVSGKYHPVRTYRCDNGLFIAEDMK